MTIIKMMLALGATTLWAGAATAQQVGVVGLYQNGASLDAAAATDLGCFVQRSGAIVAMQGKLSPTLTQPDQFVVLACDQSVMASSERRAALADISDGGESIAIFEGALTDLEKPANPQDALERQYILKLGYYNNVDVEVRNTSLMALDAKAAQLEGVWTTESFLHVHSAAGIATPDEVVILYYDTAEIAGNFREENADILEDVSAFNDAHLTGFAYLIGTVTE